MIASYLIFVISVRAIVSTRPRAPKTKLRHWVNQLKFATTVFVGLLSYTGFHNKTL
jgi:hypothetical protein